MKNQYIEILSLSKSVSNVQDLLKITFLYTVNTLYTFEVQLDLQKHLHLTYVPALERLSRKVKNG